jgi:hypothetical protein
MPKPRAAGQERQAVKIGRPCSICRHVERRRIELACASGRSYNDVAAEFSTSRFAVNRHWARHVSAIQRAQLRMGPDIEVSKLAARLSLDQQPQVERVRYRCDLRARLK